MNLRVWDGMLVGVEGWIVRLNLGTDIGVEGIGVWCLGKQEDIGKMEEDIQRCHTCVRQGHCAGLRE